MAKTHKQDNLTNPPEHIIAAAQRMLGAAWLSDELRAAVEANIARMRSECEARDA